jgi:hypothetical protein
MKTLYLTLFICCSFFYSTAQISQLQFLNEEPLLCIDSVTPLIGYHNWEAYQTLDNTWNGPRDSSICVSLYHANALDNPSIAFDEIDIDRPIYVRAIFQENPILDENKIYYVYHDMYSTYYDIPNNDFCENGWCEGIMIGIASPSDTIDSTSVTNIKYYSENFSNFGFCSSIDMCVPTEYFQEGNTLKEFVFKLKVENVGVEEYTFLGNFDLMSTNDCTNLINTSTLPSFGSGFNSYFLYSGQFCFDNNCNYGPGNMIQWEGQGIPADTNMYFLDVPAIPPSNQIQNIVLQIGETNGLIFQPYTQIRGGLIDGSDSIRHTLSIESWGNFCLPSGIMVDMPMAPGSFFAYHRGMVSIPFGTCLRFEYDAVLRVCDDATLHYGMLGNGMIAMNSGSKIELQENAGIHFGNIFSLWDYPGQTNPDNIHIYLKKGNSLVFDIYSSILNRSLDNRMKLVVHLQGGYLDISNLDENSRKHLVVEYDRPDAGIEILSMYGNPLSDLNFTLHSNESGMASAEIFDLMGKKVMTVQLTLNEGFNQIQIPLPSIATGTYVLQIASNKASTQTKFMKE